MKWETVSLLLRNVHAVVKSLFREPSTYIKTKKDISVHIPVTEKKVEDMTKKRKVPEDNTVECYCRKCHRRLTNPKYKEVGIGPVCLKKLQRKPQLEPLFHVRSKNEISES